MSKEQVEQGLRQVQDKLAEWQREYSSLHHNCSKLAIAADERLAIALDHTTPPFTQCGLAEAIETPTTLILAAGTRCVDALWQAMILSEKVDAILDRRRASLGEAGGLCDLRLTSLMERLSHGQTSTRIDLEQAKGLVAPFFLEGFSLAELRIERVLERLDCLPWAERSDKVFNFDQWTDAESFDESGETDDDKQQ